MRKRGNHIYWLILIFTAIFLLSKTCLAVEIDEGEAFVTTSGKKIVHDKAGKLIFYDVIKEGAKAVAQIDCKGKRVIASQKGNYIAIAPGGVAETVKGSIFDDSGKLSGEFTNNEFYNLRSISDTGPLIGLGYEGLDIPLPYPTKLYNSQGKILYDITNAMGGIKFAVDGTPVIFETDSNTGQFRTLSLVDREGKTIAKYNHEINPVRILVAFDASGENGTICMMLKLHKEIHADRFLVWLPASGTIREIEIVDKNLGIVQPDFSISPNGNYVAIKIGYKGLLLYDVQKDNLIYKREFNLEAGGQVIQKFLDIAVDNNARVLATGLYDNPLDNNKKVTTCSLLDKAGNVLNSTIVNRSFSDRRNIQLLYDGSFAISSGSDDKVIVVK